MMNNRYMLLSVFACFFVSMTHTGTMCANSDELTSSWEIERPIVSTKTTTQRLIVERDPALFARSADSTPDGEDKTLRILSIDSGGIRGVVPLVILNHIEQQLNWIFHREEGEEIRIADCFDVIAGVSTGGFIALGLTLPDSNGRPRYSAQEIMAFYESWKESFPKPKLPSILAKGIIANKPLFKGKIIDDSLETFFGNETFFRETKQIADVIIPVFDLENDDLYYFDSYASISNGHHDYLVKDVARATISVVGYLPAKEIEDRQGDPHTYIDGIVVENPSVDAYTMAKTRYPDKDKLYMVSLGTGAVTRGSLAELGTKGIRSLARAGQIVVGDASSKRSKKQLERIVEYEDKNLDYRRIQTQLPEENYAFDDTTKSNFRALKGRAERRTSDQDVQKIVKDLVQYLQQEKGYTFKRGDYINPVKFAKTVLDLSHRKVKDKHLQQIFGDTAENEAIEFINLRHNEIGRRGNNGLQSIVEFLNQNPSREIEVLDLSHNPITDDHLGYLVTKLNPKVRVRHLKLNHTKVTATGLQRLGDFAHAMVPNLTVAAEHNRLSRQEHADLSLNEKLKLGQWTNTHYQKAKSRRHS